MNQWRPRLRPRRGEAGRSLDRAMERTPMPGVSPTFLVVHLLLPIMVIAIVLIMVNMIARTIDASPTRSDVPACPEECR